jgi:hypothetical protein
VAGNDDHRHLEHRGGGTWSAAQIAIRTYPPAGLGRNALPLRQLSEPLAQSAAKPPEAAAVASGRPRWLAAPGSSPQVAHRIETPPGPAGRWLIDLLVASSAGVGSAKPRSGRLQAKLTKPIVHHNTRTRSKQAAVLALLSRPRGASIAAMMQATGWQANRISWMPSGDRSYSKDRTPEHPPGQGCPGGSIRSMQGGRGAQHRPDIREASP